MEPTSVPLMLLCFCWFQMQSKRQPRFPSTPHDLSLGTTQWLFPKKQLFRWWWRSYLSIGLWFLCHDVKIRLPGSAYSRNPQIYLEKWKGREDLGCFSLLFWANGYASIVIGGLLIWKYYPPAKLFTETLRQ